MRRFILRLFNALRPGTADDDLAREVTAHLALLEDEHRRRGLSPDEARLAACRAIGSVALVHDTARDAGSFRWVDDLMRDGRHAVRRLRQTPGFAATAILTLGLGIGVNNTFFTIVNAICLRGLPIEEPDRVLSLGTRDAQGRFGGLSYAEFEAVRATASSFTALAAYTNAPVTLGDDGRTADRIMGAHVSAAAFDVLGDVPILGRGFHPEDDRPGAPPVVVIGAGVWKTLYASDPGIIGRPVIVSGAPATVIGVMPDGFRFLQNTDLWQPLGTMAGLPAQPRDRRTLFVFGRLMPNVSAGQARAEVEAIGRMWATEFPQANRGIRPTAIRINEQMNGDVTERTWLAFIMAGVLVLLIACANVANLLLMRGAVRGREIAIRSSIGATRARLVRLLLIESLLLAALGAMTGVMLSLGGLRLLSRMVPAEALPYWMTFTLDERVLAVLVVAAALSVLVFGLAPALHLLKVDVIQVIKDSGRIGSAGMPARRWTTAFLAVEFALTLVLLALVVDGFRGDRASERSDFPLDSAPLLSMWVTLPGNRYPSPESRNAFYDQIAEQFGALPGVSSVTVASVLPRVSAPVMQFEIAGQAPPDGTAPAVVTVNAGDNYFETLGMPLSRGGAFTPVDGTAGQESAIVNQRFVEMFMGTRDPIGQLIRVGRPGTIVSGPWARIVGVSPTLRQRPFGRDPDPVIYLPHRSAPSATAAIMVRGVAAPDSLAAGIREQLHRLDPDLPLYRVMPLQRAIEEAGWNPRMASVVVQNIGAIALLMALVGLYAVTAHAVHWWRPEIGLRLALGSPARDVAWIVLRRAFMQLTLGLVLGLGFIYAFDRSFTDAADPYRLTDARVLVPLIGVLAMVALAACAIPTRRAMRFDPVVALRAE